MVTEALNRPTARNITPQAEALLDVIRAETGWITRRHIAHAMDKNRLNPWDTALLEKLEDEGLIQIQRRLRSDKVTLEYIYRAVPAENGSQ